MQIGKLTISKRWAWIEKRKGFDRFGGGGTWKMGLQGSGSTVIISLIFGEIRIGWEK